MSCTTLPTNCTIWRPRINGTISIDKGYPWKELEYGAFAADYIANLLEQRARFTPQESPLHLTRREDWLDLHLQPPDLSLYQAATPTSDHPV
jgi:hypothetical protein